MLARHVGVSGQKSVWRLLARQIGVSGEGGFKRPLDKTARVAKVRDPFWPVRGSLSVDIKLKGLRN